MPNLQNNTYNYYIGYNLPYYYGLVNREIDDWLIGKTFPANLQAMFPIIFLFPLSLFPPQPKTKEGFLFLKVLAFNIFCNASGVCA